MSHRYCRPYRPVARSSKWKRGWLRACLRQRLRGQQVNQFLRQTQGKRRFSSFRAHAMYEEIAGLAKALKVHRVFAIEQVGDQTHWLIHNLWRLRQVDSRWVIEERQDKRPEQWVESNGMPSVVLWPIASDQKIKHVLAFKKAVMEKLMRMALPRVDRRVLPSRDQVRFNKNNGEAYLFSRPDKLAQKTLERHWAAPSRLFCERRLTGGHMAFRKAIWTHFLTRPVLHHWVAVHGVEFGKNVNHFLTLPKLLRWQVPNRDAIVAAWKNNAPNVRPLMTVWGGELVSPDQVYQTLQQRIGTGPGWGKEAAGSHNPFLSVGSISCLPEKEFRFLTLPTQEALDVFWASPSKMIARAAKRYYHAGCLDYWWLSPKAHRLLDDLSVLVRSDLVKWVLMRPGRAAVHKRGRPSQFVARSRRIHGPSPVPLTLRQMESLLLEFRRQQMLLKPKRGKPSPARSSEAFSDLAHAYTLLLSLPRSQRADWRRALDRSHPWAVQHAAKTMDKRLPKAVEPKLTVRVRF